MIIFNSFSLIVEYYFILELRRVRAWLESKTPLELEVNLKKGRILTSITIGFIVYGTIL
jgi:hypothetical protein